MKWPEVLDEFKTVCALLKGFSIARYGDGELKMMDGAEYVREKANADMAAELQYIIQRGHKKCLIGIPTMDPDGPKFKSWKRHTARFLKYLDPNRQYYSAFISRPDNAPWINTRVFALFMRKLWMDKRVAVVCEPTSGALRAIDPTALMATHFECPSSGAYAHIDEYEKDIALLAPDIAILSCGPTATCLAHRLARRGIQAIDFGSGGSFLAKLLKE